MSVSLVISDSRVSKKTREPSSDAPEKSAAIAALPPAGPNEMCVVAPAKRSYTSAAASVSLATSDSTVSKNSRAPSWEKPARAASGVPLPPVGPVETWAVAPPARS
jgi:hypothetical protein